MTEDRAGSAPASTLALRGAFGGVLMGLANLVPGISGGTMLLAAGVYRDFIGAIAEVTTLRFRPRSLLVLAVIGGTALAAIVLLAGAMRSLVIEHRWVMYSLFIGLTLGGVPVIWRLARRSSPMLMLGFVLGFGVMALTAFTKAAGSADSGFPILLLAGLAGASAMILPGISGAYMLLVLGQYETILGAVDRLKHGAVAEALPIVLPVGIGVVAGVVGVSNLIRWMLEKHERITLGLLLGLLVGSVLGIYPFQRAVAPESHELVTFVPAVLQIAAALGLVVCGFVVTTLVGRLGRDR